MKGKMEKKTNGNESIMNGNKNENVDRNRKKELEGKKREEGKDKRRNKEITKKVKRNKL